MSAATLADTGVRAAVVPQELLEHHFHQRASDALQTIGMALSLADMQITNLGDTRRNGGLVGAGSNLRRLAAEARDLADALDALAGSNGGPRA